MHLRQHILNLFDVEYDEMMKVLIKQYPDGWMVIGIFSLGYEYSSFPCSDEPFYAFVAVPFVWFERDDEKTKCI